MIEITHLDFRYKRTPVFNNINLRFDKGMIYGLLGENGVGKTTLLKIIMGLQEPQQGTCTVDGLNAFDRHPEMLQKVFLCHEYARQWNHPCGRTREGIVVARYDDCMW